MSSTESYAASRLRATTLVAAWAVAMTWPATASAQLSEPPPPPPAEAPLPLPPPPPAPPTDEAPGAQVPPDETSPLPPPPAAPSPAPAPEAASAEAVPAEAALAEGALPPYVAPPWYNEKPSELDYRDGEPIPAGYEKDSRIRKGLVIAGAVTFGTTWLASAVAASMVDHGGDEAVLYIPVVGPALGISSLDARGQLWPMLVMDSVAQGAGLTMLIVGLAATKTYLRRVGANDLTLTPAMGPGSKGLNLTGSF